MKTNIKVCHVCGKSLEYSPYWAGSIIRARQHISSCERESRKKRRKFEKIVKALQS